MKMLSLYAKPRLKLSFASPNNSNCKFSDSEFDIEFDFKLGLRNCLDNLPTKDDEDSPQKLEPKSVEYRQSWRSIR
jgi:hypothetical protein